LRDTAQRNAKGDWDFEAIFNRELYPAIRALIRALPDDECVFGNDTRVFNVGGCQPYATVHEALDAIGSLPAAEAPSSASRVLIQVWPGFYESTETYEIPSWVGVGGYGPAGKGLVHFQNDVTNLFTVTGDHVFFDNFLVEGSSTSTLYAFNGNNHSHIHIWNVDMLDNGGVARQRFLIQEGATWSVMNLWHCTVNYQGRDEYCCRITNSGANARFVDTWIESCFFDAFQLTNFGGSFDLRGVQDLRFWNNTIRGTNDPGGAGPFFNTGIRHRLGGVAGTPTIEIDQCRMSGALSGLGGSACFGDLGTTIIIDNSLARGAASLGTLTVNNSRIV